MTDISNSADDTAQAIPATIGYRPLLELEFEHRFFADGRCRDLGVRFEPETRKLMAVAGLLHRWSGSMLSFYYDHDNVSTLRSLAVDDADRPLELRFSVFTSDPMFSNYTAPDLFRDDSVVYFDVTANFDPAAVIDRRLSAGPTVGDADFLPAQDNPPIAYMLPALSRRPQPDEGQEPPPPAPDPTTESVMATALKDMTRRPRPMLVFRLGIDGSSLPKNRSDDPVPAPVRYGLAFENRSTVWKYYFQGAPSDADIEVESKNPAYQFERQDPTGSWPESKGVLFRSIEAIPLQERSTVTVTETRRIKTPNGTREHTRTLPVPSPAQLSFEGDRGSRVPVSDIYVSS